MKRKGFRSRRSSWMVLLFECFVAYVCTCVCGFISIYSACYSEPESAQDTNPEGEREDPLRQNLQYMPAGDQEKMMCLGTLFDVVLQPSTSKLFFLSLEEMASPGLSSSSTTHCSP